VLIAEDMRDWFAAAVDCCIIRLLHWRVVGLTWAVQVVSLGHAMRLPRTGLSGAKLQVSLLGVPQGRWCS